MSFESWAAARPQQHKEPVVLEDWSEVPEIISRHAQRLCGACANVAAVGVEKAVDDLNLVTWRIWAFHVREGRRIYTTLYEQRKATQ